MGFFNKRGGQRGPARSIGGKQKSSGLMTFFKILLFFVIIPGGAIFGTIWLIKCIKKRREASKQRAAAISTEKAAANSNTKDLTAG